MPLLSEAVTFGHGKRGTNIPNSGYVDSDYVFPSDPESPPEPIVPEQTGGFLAALRDLGLGATGFVPKTIGAIGGAINSVTGTHAGDYVSEGLGKVAGIPTFSEMLPGLKPEMVSKYTKEGAHAFYQDMPELLGARTSSTPYQVGEFVGNLAPMFAGGAAMKIGELSGAALAKASALLGAGVMGTQQAVNDWRAYERPQEGEMPLTLGQLGARTAFGTVAGGVTGLVAPAGNVFKRGLANALIGAGMSLGTSEVTALTAPNQQQADQVRSTELQGAGQAALTQALFGEAMHQLPRILAPKPGQQPAAPTVPPAPGTSPTPAKASGIASLPIQAELPSAKTYLAHLQQVDPATYEQIQSKSGGTGLDPNALAEHIAAIAQQTDHGTNGGIKYFDYVLGDGWREVVQQNQGAASGTQGPNPAAEGTPQATGVPTSAPGTQPPGSEGVQPVNPDNGNQGQQVIHPVEPAPRPAVQEAQFTEPQAGSPRVPTAQSPEKAPAPEVIQPTQGEPHATQEGQRSELDQQQHKNGNESGQAAEAGNRNSDVSRGQEPPAGAQDQARQTNQPLTEGESNGQEKGLQAQKIGVPTQQPTQGEPNVQPRNENNGNGESGQRNAGYGIPKEPQKVERKTQALTSEEAKAEVQKDGAVVESIMQSVKKYYPDIRADQVQKAIATYGLKKGPKSARLPLLDEAIGKVLAVAKHSKLGKILEDVRLRFSTGQGEPVPKGESKETTAEKLRERNLKEEQTLDLLRTGDLTFPVGPDGKLATNHLRDDRVVPHTVNRLNEYTGEKLQLSKLWNQAVRDGEAKTFAYVVDGKEIARVTAKPEHGIELSLDKTVRDAYNREFLAGQDELNAKKPQLDTGNPLLDAKPHEDQTVHDENVGFTEVSDTQGMNRHLSEQKRSDDWESVDNINQLLREGKITKEQAAEARSVVDENAPSYKRMLSDLTRGAKKNSRGEIEALVDHFGKTQDYEGLQDIVDGKPYTADNIVDLWHAKQRIEEQTKTAHDNAALATKIAVDSEKPLDEEGAKARLAKITEQIRAQNEARLKGPPEPPDPLVESKLAANPEQALSDRDWFHAVNVKELQNETARENPQTLDRGADAAVREIQNSIRDGLIAPEKGELALWLLKKNPALADDLALLIGKSQAGSVGEYNPIDALVNISASHDDPLTIAHEILHHTERLLPDDIRQKVIEEWNNALWDEIKKSTEDGDHARARALQDQQAAFVSGSEEARVRMRQAYDSGVLDIKKDYRLATPGEFWAENGSEFLNKRSGQEGLWQKAKAWYQELYHNLKRFFGLNYNPIAAGMREIFNSDGNLSGVGLRQYVDSREWPALYDRAEMEARRNKYNANTRQEAELKSMGNGPTPQGLNADLKIAFRKESGDADAKDQNGLPMLGVSAKVVAPSRGGVFQWIRTHNPFYNDRDVLANLHAYYDSLGIQGKEKEKLIAQDMKQHRELNNIPWFVSTSTALTNAELLKSNEYTQGLANKIFEAKAKGSLQATATDELAKSLDALPKEMQKKVAYEYWLEDREKTNIINKHVPEGAKVSEYYYNESMRDELKQWDENRRNTLAKEAPDVLDTLDALKDTREAHLKAVIEAWSIEHLGQTIVPGIREWSQKARNYSNLVDKAAIDLHKAIHDPNPNQTEIAQKQQALNSLSLHAQQALSMRNQYLHFQMLQEMSVERGYLPRFFDQQNAKYIVRIQKTGTDVGQRLVFRDKKSMTDYLDSLNRPFKDGELEKLGVSGYPKVHPITGEPLDSLAGVYRAQGGKIEIVKARGDQQPKQAAVNPGVLRDLINEISKATGSNDAILSDKAAAFYKAYGGDLSNLIDAKTLAEVGLTNNPESLKSVKQLRQLINAIATPNFIDTMAHRTGVEGYAPHEVDPTTGAKNPNYHEQLYAWLKSGLQYQKDETVSRIEHALILREANSQMADLATKGIAPRYQKFLANFMSGVRWVDPVGRTHPMALKVDQAISAWNVMRFMQFNPVSPIKNFSLGYVNAAVEASARPGGLKNIKSLFYGDKEYIKGLKFALGDKKFAEFLRDPASMSTLSENLDHVLKSGTDMEKVALLLIKTGGGDAEFRKSLDRTLPDWLSHPDRIENPLIRSLAKAGSKMEDWGMTPTKWVENHNRLASGLSGADLYLAQHPGDINGAYQAALKFMNNSQGNFRGYAKTQLERTLMSVPGGRSVLTLATAGLRASEQIGVHIMAAMDRPEHVRVFAPVLAGIIGLAATTGLKGGPLWGDQYNLIKWFSNHINGDDNELAAVKENWDEAMRRHFVNTMQKVGFDGKAAGSYYDTLLYGLMTKISGHNLAAENTVSGLVVDNIAIATYNDITTFLKRMPKDDAHQLFSHALKLVSAQGARIDRNVSDYIAGKTRDVSGNPVGEPVSATDALGGIFLGSKFKDVEGMLSHKEGGGKVYSDADAKKYVGTLDRLDGLRFDNQHYGYFKAQVPGQPDQYLPARVNKFHDLLLNHYDDTKDAEKKAVQQFEQALQDPKYRQQIYKIALGGQTSGRGGNEIEKENEAVLKKVQSYFASQAVRKAFQDLGMRPPAYDYANKPFGAALKYMQGVDKRAKKGAQKEAGYNRYTTPATADEERD